MTAVGRPARTGRGAAARRLAAALLAWAGAASAATPALDVAAAWQGWARPGRVVELDLRMAGDAAAGSAQATLQVDAGSQTMHGDLTFVPGQPLRLRLPVPAAPRLAVELRTASGALTRRELVLSLSESPLLALALDAATPAPADRSGEPVLAGFHAIAVGAPDLPQHAPAFGGVDALLVDAATLAALRPAQLDALLGHAAACGRIAVAGAHGTLREVLRAAAGCGSAALVFGDDAADALAALHASLGIGLPATLPTSTMDALAPAETRRWQQVAASLAVALGLVVLAFVFTPTLPAVLAVCAGAAGALLAVLAALPDTPQLVVWGEATAGGGVARYQAWHRLAGGARGASSVPLPPQLAPSVRACDTGTPLRLALGPQGAPAVTAAIDTRLFQRTALCYEGHFPIERALAVEPAPDGQTRVRNAGVRTLPAGRLLADGRAYPLPALAGGGSAVLAAERPLRDAVERLALSRTPAGAVAALWPLALGGVDGLPPSATGWLLVRAPGP